MTLKPNGILQSAIGNLPPYLTRLYPKTEHVAVLFKVQNVVYKLLSCILEIQTLTHCSFREARCLHCTYLESSLT